MGPSEYLWVEAIVIGCMAAFIDFKDHSVPNKLWIGGLIAAVPFLLAEAFQSPLTFFLRLGCAGLFAGALWALWQADSFGGADMKGFSLFGLLLSPVGYFDPLTDKIFPALDILVTAMIVSWVFQKMTKGKPTPLFSVSLIPLLVVSTVGGLAWWPLTWPIRHFLLH